MSSILDFLKSLWLSLKNFFTSTIDTLVGAIKDIIGSTAYSINKALKFLIKFAQTAVNSMVRKSIVALVSAVMLCVLTITRTSEEELFRNNPGLERDWIELHEYTEQTDATDQSDNGILHARARVQNGVPMSKKDSLEMLVANEFNISNVNVEELTKKVTNARKAAEAKRKRMINSGSTPQFAEKVIKEEEMNLQKKSMNELQSEVQVLNNVMELIETESAKGD